ncbi:type III pantothenate kinase [Helicobacter winghamensis]|uniref:Type III pantothenate kinase n=1 Tax=Helicobacter winghamensis TaxID=157268 RepID=A0A2N3PIV4_9HELI|nr:type III pantothenate kinase [Helicobacter winghamensis]EEO25313.1 pantothenate kinase [Helicobacter winghamensis ATCC BAA-430]PKT76352.1 pantothenate kinase [Helicobacter winghamensis]PKT76483.1 pantothenate kinase [Helicobacter winghamensis]PKT76614.1 pantothenate kinase [Helicobacter winghamensis]PKT80863.1 pantothenate kinase [Helicobacter winghamensis]
MILCDIGNSFLHFYYRGRIWKEDKHALTPKDPKETIIFISVNKDSTNALLRSHNRCFDLCDYLSLDTTYKGLGVDRVAACMAINDGVIVDAGSAITIDVMHQGIHLGGFIMPGISQYRKMFENIAVLDQDMNFAVDLYAFPQNTKDAISYGMLKSIVLMLQTTSKNKRIHFTGGDGKFLSHFFKNCFYDDLLVFKGMQKAIEINFTAKGIYL